MKNKKLNIETGLEIIEEVINNEKRLLNIKILNKKLFNYSSLYIAIFFTLLKSNSFRFFSKDIVFISLAETDSKQFILHNNIYFDVNLNATKFLQKCKLNIIRLTNENYFDENIIFVKIMV